MEIVINKCWGGFSISVAAAKFMAKRGHKQAAAEVAEWEIKKTWVKQFKKTGKWPEEAKYEIGSLEIDIKYNNPPHFFGYGYIEGFSGGYERTDPVLVEAVENLGKKANGSHAFLSVVEIPDGVEYEIENYDGRESIHEKHQSWG